MSRRSDAFAEIGASSEATDATLAAMTNWPGRWFRRVVRWTLLAVVALITLGIARWALPGRFGSSITVYPIMWCGEGGCSVVTAFGKTVQRRGMALSKQTFTAIPERQEVILQDPGGLKSLTRDEGFSCAVRSAREWQCQRDIDNFSRFESYRMQSGDLMHFDARSYAEGNSYISTSWCHWQQRSWSDDLATEDEPLLAVSDDVNLLHAFVLLTTGCML